MSWDRSPVVVVDMCELLQEVQGLASPLVSAAGLQFNLKLPRKGTKASADRRRVTQIALNLVANAAKYNRTGKMVELSCKQEGNLVRVSVIDDGEGIDPADAPRLFTPFDRLGQQIRAKVEGTGLGLALSKRLVESMAGQIGFERRDKGACFWFTLKASHAPTAARQT